MVAVTVTQSQPPNGKRSAAGDPANATTGLAALHLQDSAARRGGYYPRLPAARLLGGRAAEEAPGTATHRAIAAGRNIRPMERLATTTNAVSRIAEARVMARWAAARRPTTGGTSRAIGTSRGMSAEGPLASRRVPTPPVAELDENPPAVWDSDLHA